MEFRHDEISLPVKFVITDVVRNIEGKVNDENVVTRGERVTRIGFSHSYE